MPRLLTFFALVLAVPLNAHAGSPGALRSSSGGTGMSAIGGSGGTGIAPHSSASGAQPQLTPAKPQGAPPAGVRPHTDLAAATKIIGLSSGNLMKHSSLFTKLPLRPGDPSLSGPVLNKIGATEGSSASFKAVAGIPASLSSGRVYPTHGSGAGGGHIVASLSGTAADGVGDGDSGEAPSRRSSGGGLLSWLHGLFTAAGIAAIGAWMWSATPKGARMTLRATT